MRQSAVSFKAKGLTFEGVVAQPDGDGPFPGVVICHPHPLFGGNMDNNVVVALAFGLAMEGIATIRFNFRGVGNSEGEHAKGEKEHEEALAAMDLLKAWNGVDGSRIGLAGYSFGTSVVGGSAQLQKKAKAIALVSPPLRVLENTPLQKANQPAFIITGDKDKLVEAEELPAVLDSFQRRPAYEVVAGADHFWHGQEGALSRHVSQFFAEHLT